MSTSETQIDRLAIWAVSGTCIHLDDAREMERYLSNLRAEKDKLIKRCAALRKEIRVLRIELTALRFNTL